jgi:hypothetical protein
MPVGRGGPSLFWPGVLVGIGIAGTLHEVVLHQLLAWHHFYDRSTPTVGLVSDGLFHLFSTAVLVIGIIQLVERRHTTPDPPRLALAGTLLLRPTRQPSRSPHHPGPSRRPSVHSASTPTRSAAPPARVA